LTASDAVSNTYALFAELARRIILDKGRIGIIVPTGIATDDTYKGFFADLNQSHQIVSLFDFENREKLFLAVDSRMKFCLLTLSAAVSRSTEYTFFLTRTSQLRDPERTFVLSPDDLVLINPNTRTCPIFRTRTDAVLTKKIYQRIPVLLNESIHQSEWSPKFSTMFHMANDSGLFATRPESGHLPLYEAKLFHQFDHRWATYEEGEARELTLIEKVNTGFVVHPRYWVSNDEVRERTDTQSAEHEDWFIALRDITNATNERTCIASLLPWVGVGHTVSLISIGHPDLSLAFLANLNSIVFDYVVRQKIGGTHLTFFIIKQLPVLPSSRFTAGDVDWIGERVLRLIYTSDDMRCVAQRFGYHGAPFRWDLRERELYRADLDAYFAHLFELTRNELEYILDPNEVFGTQYPGETFRGLRENEMAKFGEYRTRRLVLEAFDKLAETDRFRGEMASRKSAFEVPASKTIMATTN
jgi:hypothetical protein